jgi:hypothetical protein
MSVPVKRCFLVGRLERGGTRVVVLRPARPAIHGPWTVRAVVART